MKTIITADTYVPTLDGMEFVPANTIVETDADTCHALARAGKAMYTAAKDDPSKNKAFTASDAYLDAVAKAQASAATKAPAKA